MKELWDWLAKLNSTIPAMRPAGVAYSSEHRREPGTGSVTLGKNSGVRKLKRAMRRGLVPAEWMQVIETAEASAARRAHLYANSHARMRALLRAARAVPAS